MEIYINGANHIAGRLASKVAKSLLENHNVTVFFTESISYAFDIERARKIYNSYLNKRCVVNPRKGPYHYVEPHKYFTRMVKRMLRYKTKKGSLALKRLTCYEGIPREHYGTNMSVCPNALLKVKSNPVRKSVTFGEFLKDFGWKHHAAVRDEVERYKEFRKIEDEKINCREEMIEKTRNEDWFKRKVEDVMNSYE